MTKLANPTQTFRRRGTALSRLCGVGLVAIGSLSCLKNSAADSLLTDAISAYTDGGLAGQGAWTSTGGGGSAAVSVTSSGNLSATGLFPSAGGKLVVPGNAAGVARPFTLQSSNDVYCSFIVKVVTRPSGEMTLAGMWSGATGNNQPVALRVTSATPPVLMVRKAGSNIGTGFTATVGATYFIVLRYTFQTGNDAVALWVNPDPATFGLSPPTMTGGGTGSGDATGLLGVFVRDGGGGSSSGSFEIDEIRVGTTWADVTPGEGCIPPTISANPTNQTVNAGSTGSFSVAAAGSNRSYQWQISTNSGANWNNATAGSGTTAAGYTTPALAAADSGSQFRCIVSVPCTNVTATSQVATVTVVCNTANISQDPPPTVNSYVNSSASFFVTAAGTARTYQWQASPDNGGTWNNVGVGTGGTTSNYTTPTLTLAEDQMQYRCLVSVPCDNSSKTSSVSVLTIVDPAGLSFRSAGSGDWSNPSTWEQSSNGVAWAAATAAPFFGNSNITVRAGHIATISTPLTVDDVVVETGGQVTVNGGTLTIADSTATTNDVDVAGTLEIDSNNPLVINSGAQARFTGTYRWNSTNIGNIPIAFWDTGSTCEIANGFTSGNAGTAPTGLNQSFYNFHWNWPGSKQCNLASQLTTVRNTLRINGATDFNNSVRFLAAGSCDLNVGGNVVLEGGYTTLSGGSAASTILNWYVGGNFIINPGAALDSRSSAVSSAANIYFTNNTAAQSFTNSGNITHTGAGGGCPINWFVSNGCTLNLAGNLTLATANLGNRDSVTVDGALNCNGNQITGAGNLTISATGVLTGNSVNPIASGLNAVAFGGTLSLPGLPPLTPGDTLSLFSAVSYSGSSVLSPLTPGAGQTWDTGTIFTLDGILRVNGSGGGTLRIDSVVRVGTDLILTGSGGTNNGNFSVLTSTNPGLPLLNWTSAGASQFDAGGNFTVTNPVTMSPQFFIIQQVP